MYSVSVKTDSGNEPVTEAVIKNYIKYDESDATEVALINSLVKGARELLEKYLNLSLKSKTYILTFKGNAIDDYILSIPYGPIVSITSLKYKADGVDEETLTEDSDYYVHGNQFKELYIVSPLTDGYYTLEYVSGYGGTDVETLPDVLAKAICKQTLKWYERTYDAQLDKEVIGMVAPYSKQYFI